MQIEAATETLNEVPVKTPLEALTWLQREMDAPSTGTIPFIDLAAQQALIRSNLAITAEISQINLN